MRRFRELTGLEPVEYPTTRQLGASPVDRARDVNAALRDPSIRALITTIGGEDEITVIRHLNADALRSDPKPILGYSDNTNLLHWAWEAGVASFYGGATQVHFGPGPYVDDIHLASVRAALLNGGRLELTEPGDSEDFGHDWLDPRALTEFGTREPTDGFTWAGAVRRITGPTWGGCLEVLQWILAAGRLSHAAAAFEGGVLLIETSEMIIPAEEFGYILRCLGERGILGAAGAILVARPPASSFTTYPDDAARARYRADQRDCAVEVIGRYNPDAVVCVGVPFGHTRPQWVLPYGGTVTVDGEARRLWADYD